MGNSTDFTHSKGCLLVSGVEFYFGGGGAPSGAVQSFDKLPQVMSLVSAEN